MEYAHAATSVTVPVLIDDAGGESDVPTSALSASSSLVRCVYFAIDVATPLPNWHLSMANQSMPFLMLGLSGIIVGTPTPSGTGNGAFLTTIDIDRTFDFIEQTLSMTIETGRIYLPLEFTESQIKRPPQVHDVLRVRGDLFSDAIAFAQGRMMEREFDKQIDRYKNPQRTSAFASLLEWSREETKAFEYWCKESFGNARQQESVWSAAGELRSEEDRSKMEF